MTNTQLIIALSNRAAHLLTVGDPAAHLRPCPPLTARQLIEVDRTVAALLLTPEFAQATVDLATAGELVDRAVTLLYPELCTG